MLRQNYGGMLSEDGNSRVGAACGGGRIDQRAAGGGRGGGKRAPPRYAPLIAVFTPNLSRVAIYSGVCIHRLMTLLCSLIHIMHTFSDLFIQVS